MPKHGTALLTGLAAVSALAVGVTSAALLGSGASGSVATTSLPSAATVSDAGWLVLKTGTIDSVTLDKNMDGTAEATQTLASGSNCRLSTNGSLLGFLGKVGTGTANQASFGSDSIGVAEKKSGVSCYQIGAPSESLALSLGPNARGSVSGLWASSALLDVELKQGAQILATAKLDGVVTGYYELRSASSITSPKPLPAGVSGTVVTQCSNNADSGPDSGVGDNCRWPISAPSWTGGDSANFDSLTLQTLQGSFSLEGGGDGLVSGAQAGFPQRASFFEMVEPADGVLDCNGVTVTRDASGTAPEVTVRRLDNADSAQSCSNIPYTLSNDPGEARFLKPLDQQTTAQFVSDFVWTLPFTGSTTSLPPTIVDFEIPTAGTQTTIGWCPNPIYSGTITIDGITVPKLVGIADPLGPSVPDLDPDDGGASGPKQFACVGVQSASVVDGSPDTIKLVEQVYVLGDILFKKA